MSRWITYQPIDVASIQNYVFPYILGEVSLAPLLKDCKSADEAENEVRPFHDAYVALQQGNDYYDLQWGHCDPMEFIIGGVVGGVLRFSGHLHPNWGWNNFTSIDLLGDDIPILDIYQMPISLFEPLTVEFPDLSLQLETIVEAEEVMGGVVPHGNVSRLLEALRSLCNSIEISDDNREQALRELEKALAYAEENGLSYTERVD